MTLLSDSWIVIPMTSAMFLRYFFPYGCIHVLLLQADLEEAKTQENAKLQSALQQMQLQFKETKETLMKECEAAKMAAEQIPVIQEVPVVDHSLMDKITAENEKLKVKRLDAGFFELLFCVLI